ncbi:MAG: hypothetical protein M1818_006709 [Claussenomyces sp. TS43310]|nr:MAG: hypothetical protein M1818_006709 [Claussenomyces sp. TS43310]
MHELFTVAAVPEKRVRGVLMILQGLCAMTPVRQLEWRFIFEGPRNNPLIGIGPTQIQSRKTTNLPLWKELHDQLVRQSYYLSIIYNVDPSMFGRPVGQADEADSPEEGPIKLEELQGTLRFFDFPDPPGTRSVNSRLTIQIKDETHLLGFLQDLNYNYSTDFVREAFYAYRDNVVFCLSRDLQRPAGIDDNQNGSSGGLPRSLPEFPALQPFDREDKWTLTASVEILDGTQPILMQKGIDQLAQVKQDLGGICDFVMSTRQQLDTRVLSAR